MAKKPTLKGIEHESGGVPNTVEEASAMLISRMSDVADYNINTMTQINDDGELLKLAVLKAVADKYELPLLQTVITEILQMKISLRREGRKELASMINNQLNQAKDMGFRLLNKMRMT